jgi:hypothetical protein
MIVSRKFASTKISISLRTIFEFRFLRLKHVYPFDFTSAPGDRAFDDHMENRYRLPSQAFGRSPVAEAFPGDRAALDRTSTGDAFLRPEI